MAKNPIDNRWEVVMTVRLDRRETNELFLAGDKLISWPTDDMCSVGSGPVDRSSMFLSEIIARPAGLSLMYETAESADRASRVLEFQVRAAVGG